MAEPSIPDPPDDLLDSIIPAGEIPAGIAGVRRAWAMAKSCGPGFEPWQFVCLNGKCGEKFTAIIHRQDCWVACPKCLASLYVPTEDRDALRPELEKMLRLRTLDG